jgi:hypothetical protein
MPQPLSGPSQGLPYPQSLYPAALASGVLQPPTNTVTLAPGDVMLVPRGSWWIEPGPYAFVQILDPVTGVWRGHSAVRRGGYAVSSDGFTTRVANLTGCAVAAIVTSGGSGYAQATTTVTPSAGNSAWHPVIGGLVNTTISITAGGSGYGIAPLVLFSAPPNPGVPATGYATLTGTTVSAITVVNQGAGYQTAPTISIRPSPLDPNYVNGVPITQATATCSLTGSGALAAVLCTNNGAPFATNSVPTLTIAGAGSGATASIVQLSTLTGATIAGGAGYNSSAELTTVGGIPAPVPAYANPAIELTGYIPRKAMGLVALNGTTLTTVSSLLDAGIFAGTPVGAIIQSGAAPTTPTTISLATGSQVATVMIQPLG